MRGYIETPYGEIYRNELGDLILEYETLCFGDFSPSNSVDNDIDNWLIDNDYKILDRAIYFHGPSVETVDYIYYNDKTKDYEEVEVPVGYEEGMEFGSFVLEYKLERK